MIHGYRTSLRSLHKDAKTLRAVSISPVNPKDLDLPHRSAMGHDVVTKTKPVFLPNMYVYGPTVFLIDGIHRMLAYRAPGQAEKYTLKVS